MALSPEFNLDLFRYKSMVGYCSIYEGLNTDPEFVKCTDVFFENNLTEIYKKVAQDVNGVLEKWIVKKLNENGFSVSYEDKTRLEKFAKEFCVIAIGPDNPKIKNLFVVYKGMPAKFICAWDETINFTQDANRFYSTYFTESRQTVDYEQ